MKKRTVSLLLTAAMTATALAGCGGSQGGTGETSGAGGGNSGAGAQTQAQASQGGNAGGEAKEFSYPMEAGDKLTYWCELTTTVSANYASLGDTPFAKGWQAETGAQIEFLHPPAGQLKEQFSLILADGNLPDLMEYNWMVDYPGGPEKAIKDGVILPLNDIFEQYCPNLTAYLQANPDIDKMIKTDEGHYYVFPFIRN